MEPEFPISTYITLQKELNTERASLEKEKADWNLVRATLSEAEAEELDNRFCTDIEYLIRTIYNPTAPPLLEYRNSLRALVKQGASARLMSTHELDGYNLAMFIKDIYRINGEEELDLAADIVRTTIIADADMEHQKAYVGNGGITSIEQVCAYLAIGVNWEFAKLTIEQYGFCYRIFPWLAQRQDPLISEHGEYNEPYHLFRRMLRSSPDVEDLQEKTLLRIMSLGWTPFSITDEWLSARAFAQVALANYRLLTMLIPYEREELQPYLDIARERINPVIVKYLLNAFTSDKKIRKHVRTFFSHRPHWLLKKILSETPETIFDLVRRNEQDLLIPFLKHYKQDIIALRNKDDQTLLQYAVKCRSTVENTIQLLRQTGIAEQR
ncbi:hypothetical protein [Chitinophaga pinensis]|uniref:Uncharacterized protein n=1 Tax=Chitinophaga pinensis (strain ATCC 43595 / DSM 2588 / LMG 13176 / NBRC 15968 / NCIMB 11800 / UQM 2034) TaxID=485918 RepID=A0A979G3W1_CHIPD|nr:hypothetical protein [Chitinophaga pinensis]ACU60355.1 hypothetical protein Cpin_2876 [Chitinophaga pinensis DSM 2588]